MNNVAVEHYMAKTYDDIFAKFQFRPSGTDVKFVKCLAYEAIVTDEVMAVYEMYVDKIPHFYGVYELDHDMGDDEHTIGVFKSWSRSTEIKLLERTDTDFLFELIEPLGIHFSSGVEIPQTKLSQEIKDIITGTN